jgi:heptosyltransferase-2
MSKKILVMQTAFLGDVILSLPIIYNIKRNYPDYLIDFLCIPYTKEVLLGNIYINQVIVYDKHKTGKIEGILDISRYLHSQNYDLAIIPHRSIRSGIIALLAKIPERIGFDKLFFNWLYTSTKIYNRNIHEVDRNLDLLEDFHPDDIRKIPEIITGNEKTHKLPAIFEKINNLPDNTKIIAVAPGSIWETKRWLPEYYHHLCARLAKEKFVVVFIGGKNDRKIVEAISTGLNGTINLCGELDIKGTALILKKCALLIANDSAAIHIASSVDLPAIDIFGPTVPEFGFPPLSKGSINIEDKKLNCRPCGIHGAKKCPVGTFDCMKNISPDLVYDSVKEIVGQ